MSPSRRLSRLTKRWRLNPGWVFPNSRTYGHRPAKFFLKFQFPDSAEGGHLSCGVGQSEFELAMTHKVITLEFVVPTVLAIVLGILLSIGAVYLTDRYLGPADQPEPYHSSASSR